MRKGKSLINSFIVVTCNATWGLVSRQDLYFSLSLELLKTLGTTDNYTKLYRYQKKEAKALHYFSPKIMIELILSLCSTQSFRYVVLFFYCDLGCLEFARQQDSIPKAFPHCNDGNCWLFTDVQWSAQHSMHAWMDIKGIGILGMSERKRGAVLKAWGISVSLTYQWRWGPLKATELEQQHELIILP